MNFTRQYDIFHSSSTPSLKIIEDNNFTYCNILEGLNKVLRQRKTAMDILDYGCGVGTISLYLANAGNKIIGVDISPKAIETARKSCKILGLKNVRFFTASGASLTTDKQLFDLIVCTEVVEHIDDDNKLIQKLYSLCRKGGFLFLSTPSSNAPLYKMGLLGRFDLEVGHLRRYTTVQIVQLLSNQGFKVISVVKRESVLRNFLFTNKTAGRLIRLIKGPIVPAFRLIDNVLVKVFGESDLLVLAERP